MKILRSFIAAFSTYSRIPVPHVSLENDDMKYCLAFFPLIGVVIGALELLWSRGASALGIPAEGWMFLACFIPVAVTGGIHLDGFIDSMDAVHSFGGIEKRHEILKDPHVGAFGVIKLAEYLIFCVFCLWMIGRAGSRGMIYVYCLGFVLARSLSGISMTYFPPSKKTGMLASLRAHQSGRAAGRALIIWAAAAAALMILAEPVCGLASVGASFICFSWYRHASVRDFGGVSGDTSGCFLCMTELAQVLALAVCAAVPMIVSAAGAAGLSG